MWPPAFQSNNEPGEVAVSTVWKRQGPQLSRGLGTLTPKELLCMGDGEAPGYFTHLKITGQTYPRSQN